MTFLDKPQTDFAKVALAGAIVFAFGWGLIILLLTEALSGPFSAYEWIAPTLIWLGIPPAIIGILGFSGFRLRSAGHEKAGNLLTVAPLILLVLAAIWAWNFG